MVMAGLTNNLIEYLSRNFADHEVLLKSQAQNNYNAGIMKTVPHLCQQAKERNISSMLDDERFILSHSLEFDAKLLNG
jgi:hypothetical protein